MHRLLEQDSFPQNLKFAEHKVAMNTADYILAATDDHHLAIIDGEKRYTYGDLRATVATIAGALVESGVQRQERVGVFGPNSYVWVASYLAILKLGAVAVPFSPSATLAQLVDKQTLASCRVICGQAGPITPTARAAFRECLLITDATLHAHEQARSSWAASAEVDPGQIAALMFTSGTTARPRAVCVTHRNIQANTASIIAGLGIGPEDRMLVVLPFHYCFGTSLLHTHLRVGATLVLASNAALPEVLLNDMEAHSCTGFAGVPSVYQMLIRGSTFSRRSLPALRTFQQAGGKLQLALIDELAALRPDAQIFIMYGQTEATARLSVLPPEQLHAKRGSIGRGLPGVELRVVNDAGTEVSPGEVGQIIARGDNITAGYLGEPEATARTFAGGVLHTGDLALVDDDGYIYIVDRQSDFIKPLGHRVSSQEIEACVAGLPEVVVAAAIGVPDPLLGEAIKVFVTLQEGALLDGKAIIAHCKRALPRYMTPKEICILDQMPMNAQGKVLKSALRQLA